MVVSSWIQGIFSFFLGISCRFSFKYDIRSIRTAVVIHSPRETMPITYQINRPKGLAVFTWTGQVTFSEITDSLNAYGKDGPTVYELYDLRKLKGERLSKEDIDRLVDFLNKSASYRPKNSKTAVVVREDIDFGISKTIALLTLIDGVVPYQINVFRNMEQSIEWLDLAAEAGDPNGAT